MRRCHLHSEWVFPPHLKSSGNVLPSQIHPRRLSPGDSKSSRVDRQWRLTTADVMDKEVVNFCKRRAYPNTKQYLSRNKMREWKEELPFLTLIHVGGRGCSCVEVQRWCQTSALYFHHTGPRDPTQVMRNTYKWGRDGGFESRSLQSALIDLFRDVLKRVKHEKVPFLRATQRELQWGCVNCHRGTSN